jgi:hypothetical protein
MIWFGRDAAGGSAAHVLDERASAIHRLWRGSFLHAHGIPVDLELNLGVGEEAQFLPDFHRDGDLPFARDPHW